jgi:nucleotide-sensitive chloride channel 1A
LQFIQVLSDYIDTQLPDNYSFTMEVLRQAPQTGSFVPLAEHQSTTPVSFHSGPPVLHYYSDRCKVIVLEDELQNAPALSEFTAKFSQTVNSNEQDHAEETNGNHSTQKVLEEVDVWVTSE